MIIKTCNIINVTKCIYTSGTVEKFLKGAWVSGHLVYVMIIILNTPNATVARARSKNKNTGPVRSTRCCIRRTGTFLTCAPRHYSTQY